MRVKIGGGAGGHNGIRSLDQHVGKDYRRVRIGIGHPGVKEMVHGHVLSDFAKADREWLDPLLDAIADNAALLAKGDDNGFMNKLRLALPPRTSEPTARGRRRARPADAPRQSHSPPGAAAAPAAKLPETGPMAAMLKRLFGNKDSHDDHVIQRPKA